MLKRTLLIIGRLTIANAAIMEVVVTVFRHSERLHDNLTAHIAFF